ncbi:MAG: TetM/TetW/TetO/TetS family tetracycline resistance ribosomal protection protein [Ruminococcus sp.]|nr:TetM/TetW/TetO/TetS family tetracycline resistance ribosomal protection protein [Ruminococcus sp.]
MKKITLGITAHVDSGKTTLSEAILYKTGAVRTFGRVDNGTSSLDTDVTERDRGITVFSHQADFVYGNSHFFLLDTPGHADFSAETERTMQVIDYAVLVISGTDGVQSHTASLWKMLEKYGIPVFIFVNKTDLAGFDKNFILDNIQKHLSPFCADFSGSDSDIQENSAMCDEKLMEKYIEGGIISDGDIINAVSARKIFPCLFGSALRMDGIENFVAVIDRFTQQTDYKSVFSAKVYKISYDAKGNRLTHMKITGGKISVKDSLEYADGDGNITVSKINSIRFCNGEKFRTADSAESGDVCAVTGLSGTFSGQGLGTEKNTTGNFFEPVMSYRVNIPPDVNAHEAMENFRMIEDTDPQLHVIWNRYSRSIHIQLMGAIQTEVLTQIIKRKFGYDVTFEDGAVTYRETIKNTVEGMGHYEPLRHYAEVRLLLEPLERNSGLIFDSSCSEDILDRNWQRLILTHLAEKVYRGVLTGSPVTDLKITLLTGKAHLKHTEGGDFRQATYRAVRQGLRSAESVLLEPFYQYELEVPSENTGRAIADLQRMSADFDSPETSGVMSVIRGFAPVSEMNNYQHEVTGYTRGRGRIVCIAGGYRECHNADEVIKSFGYDCDGDIENTADSVFCSHGAGHSVRWYDVPQYMHTSSDFADGTEVPEKKNYTYKPVKKDVSEEELLQIFERTYGKINRDPRKAFKKTKAVNITQTTAKRRVYEPPDYLLVDGYNIIFAWDNLRKTAEKSLDSARAELVGMMSSYQGYTGYEIIIVFDAYRVSGNCRETENHGNVKAVYTKEHETADTYIEKLSHELSEKHRVRVATSDGTEQAVILGNGAMRISARELLSRYIMAEKSVREEIDRINGHDIKGQIKSR